MSKLIHFTDTTFRDGQQSLIATRLSTEEILPIAEIMDKAGFHSMEVWGGATFDVCLRYLNENPWERLRKLKKVMPNTPTQMLLRNKNLVGYKPYSYEIVELFINKAAENGMDVFRVFDALNDINNMEESIKLAKKTGKHVQGSILYAISPVHDTDHFIDTAKNLIDAGVDSLCFKDVSGMLAPQKAYEILKKLLELGVPVQFHGHSTSGMAPINYYKAMEAGISVLDCAMSSFALGSSQPPLETMIASLEGTGLKHSIDTQVIMEANKELKALRDKKGMDANRFLVDTLVILHQIPGGMISNMEFQLGQIGMQNRLDEVLEEVPKVREDLGYPILATPTSQIVGSQAVMNVMYNERYKVILKEVKDYVNGAYGHPVGKIDKDLVEKVKAQDELNKQNNGGIREKSVEDIRKEIGEFYYEEEDILSYVLFPEQALKYFKYRYAQINKVDYDYIGKDKVYPV